MRISPRFQARTVSPESPNPAPNPHRHGENRVIVFKGALLPERSAIKTAVLGGWPHSLQSHGYRLHVTDGLSKYFSGAILLCKNELINISK